MAQPSLTLLHTSDIHIGAFTGTSTRDADKCLRSFRAVVDLALQEQVDLVIIAGDFFDHNRVSQRVTDFTLEQLLRLPMPTVILPGNHDPLTEDSAYWRMDLSRAANVHLIQAPEGETVSLPHLDVAVWGRPHYSYEDVVYPLRDLPPRGPETWQIAIAHGHYMLGEGSMGRTYPIFPEEVIACDRDYVALGHFDGYALLADGPVVACYSGSPTWAGTSALVRLHGEDGARRIEVEKAQVQP